VNGDRIYNGAFDKWRQTTYHKPQDDMNQRSILNQGLNPRGTIFSWDIWLRIRLKSRHGIRAISWRALREEVKLIAFSFDSNIPTRLQPSALAVSNGASELIDMAMVKQGVQDPVAGLSRAQPETDPNARKTVRKNAEKN
jgi:hypothetical protein